jgi:hypothetical protein
VGAAPQPLHRQWLHALEDDLAIPPHVMQVARVYADFAAASKDGRVHVSWRMLRRCTHQRNDRITQSLDYLTFRGWLIEEPAKNGQRKYYWLVTAPVSGSAFRAVSAPVDVSGWEVA